MSGEDFTFVDRVRFADLDARGHLNNVAFLQFFEAARIAFLRSVDDSYDPTESTDEDLIMARSEIDYLAQAAFEEEVRTSVRAAEVEEKKLVLELEMRSAGDGRVLARGSNVMVGFDYARQETRALPEGLARGLKASRSA